MRVIKSVKCCAQKHDTFSRYFFAGAVYSGRVSKAVQRARGTIDIIGFCTLNTFWEVMDHLECSKVAENNSCICFYLGPSKGIFTPVQQEKLTG